MLKSGKTLHFGGALLVAVSLLNVAVSQDNYRLAASESHETTADADLLNRVAALEAQLKGGMSSGYEGHGEGGCGCGGGECGGGCCDSCGDSCGCGCCNCDPCCRSEGFYYGAEVSFLQPHNTSGVGVNGFSAALAVLGGAPGVAAFDGTIDPDFQATPRIWVGYQRCDGLGVRARYWKFDHEFDGDATLNGAVIGTAFHEWDTWVADFEITDSTRLGCHWDATLSYGYRHVDYTETRGVVVPGVPFAIAARKRFEGDGVTTSLEIRRQASDLLSLYANVRASILVNDETNTLAATVPGLFALVVTERQANDIKCIIESQAGVEYTMPACCGGWYYARAGVEFQYWDSFGASPIALLFDESAGFAGFSLSAGMAR